MERDTRFLPLSVFTVETYQPLDACPRITMFHHAIAKDAAYCYEGRLRAKENHCIFHYNLSGRGQFWQGSTCRNVLPGQGFLQIINDPNSGYRYPPDGTEPWEFIVFCLDGGNTRAVVTDLIAAYGPLFTIPRQHPLLQQLLNHPHLRPGVMLNTGESYRLCAVLFSMLMDCAVQPDAFSASAQLLHAIQRELHAHPGIRVAELAGHLGCSREHLTRQFHAITGKSLKQYCDEQKLLYICDLLLHTNLSIEEISRQVQFSTPTNLYRFFKDKTGMAPSAFRQRGVPPCIPG